MNDQKKKQGRVKPFVFVRPSKPKEFVVVGMMACAILIAVSPFVKAVNSPALILGMPRIMFVSLLDALLVIVILLTAYKLEVH